MKWRLKSPGPRLQPLCPPPPPISLNDSPPSAALQSPPPPAPLCTHCFPPSRLHPLPQGARTRSREDAVVSRAALATLARACGQEPPTLSGGVEFWRLAADDPTATAEAAAWLDEEEAIEAFEPAGGAGECVSGAAGGDDRELPTADASVPLVGGG
eukprot:scaffold215_cov137-Isochrysis_galbana.AAC.3